MMVFPALTVVPKRLHFQGELVIICDHSTRFTEGPEVFTWIKAEATGVAEGSGSAAFVILLDLITIYQQVP